MALELFTDSDTQKTFYSWIVAEKQEEYSVFVPYKKRKDLKSNEIIDIGRFQDVHSENFQKQDWSFNIPLNWKKKSWCYVINSFCRSEYFKDFMTPDEQILVSDCVSNIENAIRKSHVPGNRFIYRGVFDIDWLPDSAPGSEYTEHSFGSYSLDVKKALEYTNPESPILFRLILNSEMKALYLDKAEKEVLRPKGTTYLIDQIKTEEFEIRPNVFKMTTVYNIIEVKR
ncbi:hypothetical protein MmiAt1_06320 [Methanimicrococcus sp. At1]|uniref:ADP ribosyltransferase domain-containing protein n=1 Tax=Methanimicrococcus hacksteinii TaxID=3028293 RepID=A0ABU3VNX9_9EURY|nr:ADP-ribosyltransferase [Methanimicrococcus sp. At1]MDV0445076.1 hypothetical protein [Methanimicrococcus sp. At1]